MQCACVVCQGPGSDMSRLLVESQTAEKSESAGGLMVKALGQKLRDLDSSPSQCSPFLCYKIALEKVFTYS